MAYRYAIIGSGRPGTAAGSIPPGVTSVERAISGEDFVKPAAGRGFDVRREIRRA